MQQTIRIKEEVNAKIKKKALDIGCSYNSLINVLLDLGLSLYEAKPLVSSYADIHKKGGR